MEKTLKQQFAELKADLASLFNSSLKFMDFKLADGTLVRCDTETIAKGSKLDVIDEKGNMLAMPNGDYEMPETGVKFTVESGYVKEMLNASPSAGNQEQAAAPNDAPPADDKTQDAPDLAKIMDAMTALEARVKALEDVEATEVPAEMKTEQETQAATIVAMSAEIKTNKEAFAKLFNMVEEIANATEDPTAKPKDKFLIEKGGADLSKIEEFRNKYLQK